jgi:hypothetical protein
MGWSPGSGDWIAEFGTIYAVYSNGRDPAVVAEERAQARRKAQEKKQQQRQQQQQQQQQSPAPTLPPIFPPRR